MILKETLRNIARKQKEELLTDDKTVEREKLREINIDINLAIILSGVRRCGKSTLLRQLIKKTDNFYYFNFEDPRANGFELEDFYRLNEAFQEEFGDSKYYFFDEIQNVEKWELFVRSMLDKNRHFIITGSNASLLSKELGTKLTGRHIRYELMPFSYNEFLALKNRKKGIESFGEYLKKGGFPQYLKIEKIEMLQELFNDIITRDISVRHKIRSEKSLKQLSLYLIANIGREFSYNSLRKAFKLSINTIISFISYFEDAYILFSMPKFDYSYKKQLINKKKIYAVDNGFAVANSNSFSENKGRMLENMVFLSLRRNYNGIYYFSENRECDFLVKEQNKITQAIQVCYELNEENKEREISGLIEALKKFKLNSGLILTYNQEDKIKVDGKIINVIPVWKWL